MSLSIKVDRIDQAVRDLADLAEILTNQKRLSSTVPDVEWYGPAPVRLVDEHTVTEIAARARALAELAESPHTR